MLAGWLAESFSVSLFLCLSVCAFQFSLNSPQICELLQAACNGACVLFCWHCVRTVVSCSFQFGNKSTSLLQSFACFSCLSIDSAICCCCCSVHSLARPNPVHFSWLSSLLLLLFFVSSAQRFVSNLFEPVSCRQLFLFLGAGDDDDGANSRSRRRSRSRSQ